MGCQKTLVLRPEGLREVMEDGHSSPSKRKGGKGIESRFRPGAGAGAGYIQHSPPPPQLPCSSLALLLASLAPSSSQASRLSRSLESRVLHCCEVRRRGLVGDCQAPLNRILIIQLQ